MKINLEIVRYVRVLTFAYNALVEVLIKYQLKHAKYIAFKHPSYTNVLHCTKGKTESPDENTIRILYIK